MATIPTLGAERTPGHTVSRAATRELLGRATYDLLVIGGGILGTATAWTAAQAGLKVAMVDAGDFAGATSSASSKLVHGGLRYLQTGAVKLVAENHKERRALATDVAPHLVNPLTFFVPVYKGGPHSAPKLGAGVFLYSALSAFRDGMGRVSTAAHAAQQVPALRTEDLRSVAVYGDHQMNDARMAVMTVRAAVEAGAVVLNHAEVTGLRFTRGRVTGAELKDRLDGTEFGVDARLVLNATGPWVDHLRKLEDAGSAPSIRLSKGAHVVVKRRAPWRAALTIPIDKYRVSFAIPWEDHVLLGTTDEEYTGDPLDVRATDADVDAQARPGRRPGRGRLADPGHRPAPRHRRPQRRGAPPADRPRARLPDGPADRPAPGLALRHALLRPGPPDRRGPRAGRAGAPRRPGRVGAGRLRRRQRVGVHGGRRAAAAHHHDGARAGHPGGARAGGGLPGRARPGVAAGGPSRGAAGTPREGPPGPAAGGGDLPVAGMRRSLGLLMVSKAR